MKILHTSDWHLGHTLYNYDRTEEQMAMLLQMVNIVREEKPDVFLLMFWKKAHMLFILEPP